MSESISLALRFGFSSSYPRSQPMYGVQNGEWIPSLKKKATKLSVVYHRLYHFYYYKMPFSREFQEKLFMASNYVGYVLVIWPVFLILIYVIRKKQVQI